VGVDRLEQVRFDVGGLVQLGQRSLRSFAAGPGVRESLAPVACRPAELDLVGGRREPVPEVGGLGRGLHGQDTEPSRQLTVGHRRFEVVGVPLGRETGSSGLLDPADHPCAPVVAGLAAPPEVDAAVDQPALHLLEPAGAEQPLQHRMPLRRGRPQERLEPALRQHRHLGELRAGHPEQPGHQLSGLVEPVGQRDPLTPALLLDDDVGLHPGGAGAATFGAVPRGGAGEPEGARADARPQHHPRLRLRICVVAAQVARTVPVAGDLAVEREADRVEHAGLAGPGVAGQQEQAAGRELVEVDVHGVDERAEGRDRQLVQAHQPLTQASRSTTRSGSSEQHSSAVCNSADSAPVAGVPRT
jgi:hypothetical protein